MDPTVVTKAADYAAQQSDRWLFIALLVVGGISIAFITRYFMAQLAAANTATYAAHQQLADYLKTTAAQGIAIIAECRDAMHRVNARLEAAEDDRQFRDRPQGSLKP